MILLHYRPAKDYVDTQITAEDSDIPDPGTIAIDPDSETPVAGGTGLDSCNRQYCYACY